MFNWSDVHFFGSTSYEIQILDLIKSVTFLSGESLSDEEKDMEEDEKEDGKDVDEQDDDGFFVGHGVLDKNELKG